MVVLSDQQTLNIESAHNAHRATGEPPSLRAQMLPNVEAEVPIDDGRFLYPANLIDAWTRASS